MGAPFQNHKTFAANFFDPIGIFGGKKGFLGLGEDKNEKRDREAAAAAASQNAPSVMTESGSDPEALKRIGRASLISSSPRGVLSQGETSSRKLFGVQ